MKVQSWPSRKGAATHYEVDYSVLVGRLGTTVSTVTWSVESGSATISGETLASGVASALITTGSEDCSLIKLEAVLADGQTDVFFFKIKTEDPKCVQSTAGRY